jgi:hypothetical protein
MEPDFLMEIMDLNEEIIEADDRFSNPVDGFLICVSFELHLSKN